MILKLKHIQGQFQQMIKDKISTYQSLWYYYKKKEKKVSQERTSMLPCSYRAVLASL